MNAPIVAHRAAQQQRPGFFARALYAIAPRFAARFLSGYYDAASGGRRASGWRKASDDPNSAARSGQSVRGLARDAIRNSGWARRAVSVISNNVVGWGIRPRHSSSDLLAAWDRWAESTGCDRAGMLTFYGIERLVIETVATSGEAIIVRHLSGDGAVPLQIQVLEPDHLDTGKNGPRIIDGVEFDERGRRVAYWLFAEHPGRGYSQASQRTPAADVLHVYRVDRPGQVRGVTWFAPILVALNDFGDYQDALLMRQKVAATFSVFVRDITGENAPIGQAVDDDDSIDSLEPGMIHYLKPGEDIQFASPPQVTDSDSFSRTVLHGIAAGLGVTYEDISGDYSQVNYSSARMGRVAHWSSVVDWRNNLMIPQFCDRVWDWFAAAAVQSLGVQATTERPEWFAPPMPMVEPEKDADGYIALIRAGAMTPSEMVSEMGYNPDRHWATYSSDLKLLDNLGIVLDSDARKTSRQGQGQPDTSAPVQQ